MNTIMKALLVVTAYSSVMIAAVLAMRAIWNGKINSKIIRFLWLLVLIRLLLPITFESPVHFDGIFPESQAAVGVSPVEDPALEVPFTPAVDAQPGEYYEKPDVDLAYAEGSTPPQTVEAGPSFFERAVDSLKGLSIWLYVFALWIAGAAVFLLKTLNEYLGFKKRVIRSENSECKKLACLLAECKESLKCKKGVCVLACRYLNAPVTFGFLKPVILIPKSFAGQMEGKKLKMIMMHELCHIKNRDILKNMLWLAAKAVHWFNPLVWVAYKYYLEDVELACDETVIKIIGQQDRFIYSQSLIDVVKLTRTKVKMPATLAFCEDKSKIRKRVENMIEPKKKLKSAGFISLIMAAVLMIGCFTTACQSAPDVTVEYDGSGNASVAAENSETQKEDENAYSNEREEENALENDAEEGIARYSAPETFAKAYEKDSLKIIVDAKVNVPSGDMQSVSLSPLNLTQEFADAFINFFTGEAALYKKNCGEQSYDFLVNRLALWQQNLYNAQNNWDEVKGHDPYGNDQDRAILEIEGMIEAVQKRMETAPKEVEYEAVTSQLVNPVEEGKDVPGGEPEKITDTSRLVLDAYAEAKVSNISDNMAHYYIASNNGLADTLSYDNSNDASSSGMILRSAEVNELAKTISFTVEQADSYAKETLDGMGIKYMDLAEYSYRAAIKDGKLYPYYRLRYSRSVGGVSIKPVSEAYILTDKKDSGVCSQMETVYVDVDENGVIGFNWYNVMKQGEVLDDSLSIMDFGKIIEIAESQLLKQAYKNDGGLEIVINEISLSLMPVETGVGDEMKTIPVWDFIGYHYDAGDMEEKQKLIDSNVEFSYLTINAADGSLIDR